MAGTGFLAQAVPGPTASTVMGSVCSAVTQWDTELVILKTAWCEADKWVTIRVMEIRQKA